MYVIDDGDQVCTLVDGIVKTTLPPASINFTCTDSKMTNPSTWLGIAGLMLMGILMSRSFKGSIITGGASTVPLIFVILDIGSSSSWSLSHKSWCEPRSANLGTVKGYAGSCDVEVQALRL